MGNDPSIKNLATKSSKTRMVQKTIRQKILEALAESHMTSRELSKKIKCHHSSFHAYKSELIAQHLIEEVGERPGNQKFGTEKIWGLVTEKKKAVNAFDWRNWTPQAGYSSRELAYKNSEFANKIEKRVIVYCRA